jgi:hypothetical protein
VLLQLVAAGVLERRDEPDEQFLRWRLYFHQGTLTS